jgi:CRISPR-associated protein Cmr6
MTPLYNDHKAPDHAPDAGNRGLWFDKFCDQWCRDKSQTGRDAWTLKAFVQGKGGDRRDVNPKVEWLAKTTAKLAGGADGLREYGERLGALVLALGGVTRVFKTSSRFASGLGREHPVENGFAWHPALGTPYLPGSSVKGMVRAWIEGGWNERPVGAAVFSRIFGSAYRNGSAGFEKSKEKEPSNTGSVLFFDALPLQPVQLATDVMTPHYGDYYEGKPDGRGGIVPPADWLSPTPIPFLTVASGQCFQFAFAPRAPSDSADVATVAAWLAEALQWVGAGAKTAVGYGRFDRDLATETGAEKRRQEEKAKADQAAKGQARLAGLSGMRHDFELECLGGGWEEDKNAFSQPGLIEGWITKLEASPDAAVILRMRELVDRHFEGLLANPEKTKGKKGEPAFKDRQRQFARRLNVLSDKVA